MLKNLDKTLVVRISEYLEQSLKLMAEKHGQASLTRLARVALWDLLFNYGNTKRNDKLFDKLATLDEMDKDFGMGADTSPGGKMTSEQFEKSFNDELARRWSDDGVKE
jgi:hypothetical protein